MSLAGTPLHFRGKDVLSAGKRGCTPTPSHSPKTGRAGPAPVLAHVGRLGSGLGRQSRDEDPGPVRPLASPPSIVQDTLSTVRTGRVSRSRERVTIVGHCWPGQCRQVELALTLSHRKGGCTQPAGAAWGPRGRGWLSVGNTVSIDRFQRDRSPERPARRLAGPLVLQVVALEGWSPGDAPPR